MLPYAETLMPRWEKLTAGFIPAPSHFFNFEESVLDSSDLVDLFEFVRDKNESHARLPNALYDFKELTDFATC